MAPVHSVNSYTFSTSSSEVKSDTQSDSGSADCWERIFPVSSRGDIFEDSFFENTQTRCEEKVKRILDEWEENDTLFDDWCNDTFCSRRKMLYRNPRTRNQNKHVVSVTSADGKLKILLDVSEFTADELRVRVVGEKEIEVEGHRKQKENIIINNHKMPNKFHYLISLPEDVEMDTVTSAMSPDGFLTIYIPRKKFFNKTFHQESEEVKKRMNTQHSFGSDSTVSFSEKFSDVSSQSSSKSSTCFSCGSLLKKDKESSEKCSTGTDEEMNDYQASREIGGMRNTLETVSHVEAFNGNSQEACDDSCGFQNIGSQCEETGVYSLQDQINIRQVITDTSISKEQELQNHLFKDLPVMRRESVSNDSFLVNIKKAGHISGDDQIIHSEGISDQKNTSMICHAHGSSVVEKEIHSVKAEDQLKSLNHRKQRNEVIVPIQFEDTYLPLHDDLGKETGSLQNERSLISGTNVTSVAKQISLDSSVLEDKVSSTGDSESRIQQCNSSDQRLEENVTEEQTKILSSSLESKNVHRNVDVFQAEGQSTKSFVNKVKATFVNKQEKITKEDLTMPSNGELQACLSSCSIITESCTDEEDVNRDSKATTLAKPENSLEDSQPFKSDSSSSDVSVLSNDSVTRISRDLFITKRGSFFTDSYFEGMQDYYLTAIREILSKHVNLPSTCNEVTYYRNLRAQGQEENIATITFENENKLHFILDVYDTMRNGEISAKVIKEKEIMVTSQVNEMHNNAKLTSSFSKCLNINGEVDTSLAEVALSSEGVLVISIPKKMILNSVSTTSEANENISNFETLYANVTVKDKTVQQPAESSQTLKHLNGNEMNCVSGETGFSFCYSEMDDSAILHDGHNEESVTCLLKKSTDESNTEKSKYMVHQEAMDHQSIYNNEEMEESDYGRFFIFEESHEEEMKDKHKNEQHEQNTARDETKDLALSEKNKDYEDTTNLLADKPSFAQNKISPARNVSPKADDGDNESSNSVHIKNSKSIVVEKKGLFHEDSFFDGMQDSLREAIREILPHYYDMSANTQEEMSLYKMLINNDELKEEHHAVSTSSEDKFSYKVAVDAHKFMNTKTVILSILNDNEVEISMEENDEDEIYKCRSESFAVPDYLDINNAVAGISSDGILAIIIYKKNLLEDNNDRDIDREICEANHSSSNDQLSTCSLSSVNHHEFFSETSDAASLQTEDSVFISSPAAASEMYGEAEKHDDAETLKETQMGVGYQSKIGGNQDKWNELLNIVQTFTSSAEMKNDNDNNNNDEDDDSDASTVVGVPCSLEINSIADDESTVFSPIANYAVTLAESPQVESIGLAPCRIISENEISSMDDERSQLLHSKQLLRQSSSLSIHTVDESGYDRDDSWFLSDEGISRNSSDEDFSVRDYDSLSSLAVSGFQENYNINDSMDKAYSNQTSCTISTQSKSMNKCFRPDQKELKVNSTHFASMQSTENELSDDMSSENLHNSLHDIQMTGEHLMSEETFGFSKNAVQAYASCTNAAVRNQLCDENRRLITVTKRGVFFEDSFFSGVHENFHAAMKEILRKSSDEDKCKHSSDIASYKCWRKQNPKIENQAVYIQDDHSSHKVVLDLEGLLEDSIQVSVSEGKQILIEGQNEIEKSTSKVSYKYSQSFVLPDQVDVDAITADLSSDGILLIISPKISL